MTTADPISLAQAQRLAANADTILLRATRPADLETPIGAFLRLDDGGPAYLLESVEGGERLGRYSFLGVGPRRLLEMRDGIAYPLDWLAIVFNPSFPFRLAHMVTAAYLTTSFVVLAVGARDLSVDNPDWGGYTVDEVALRHDAGVQQETTKPEEAYSRFTKRQPTAYREGWLPD